MELSKFVSAIFDAEAIEIICSTVVVSETYMAKMRTAIIGNKDAIVTTPNPDSEESPLPAEAAIPIPNDRTSGTVTGPVVTAPQSQAKPKIVLKSGFIQAYIVKPIVGASAK